LVGEESSSGLVEQLAIEAGEVQGLMDVGVDFQLAGVTTQAEVAPSQLGHRDLGSHKGQASNDGNLIRGNLRF